MVLRMSDQKRLIETKARALRKYEGDPDAFRPAPGQPGIELLSAFGPVIGRAAVPQALTDQLNRFSDGQPRPGELLVPENVMTSGGEHSLLHLIETAVGRYAEAVEGGKPSRVQVDVAWVVAQQADTPSPAHFHSCDVSGILYLGLPPGVDDQEQLARTYISGRKAGWINFIHGDRQRFSRSLVSIRPTTGVLYLFPGWLMHVAEPFLGLGERRSLSFNAVVEA
jgi:hypothetical protein